MYVIVIGPDMTFTLVKNEGLHTRPSEVQVTKNGISIKGAALSLMAPMVTLELFWIPTN